MSSSTEPRRVATAVLSRLAVTADDGGSAEVDVSDLLGHHQRLAIVVKDLTDALASHTEPTVGLRWNDTTLTLHREDGSVIAGLEVDF